MISKITKGYFDPKVVQKHAYPIISAIGAYILSPLEEASRDPVQNAGFIVTWLNTELVSSRMASYSYRNSPVDVGFSKSDIAYATAHSKLTSGNARNMTSNRSFKVTQATSKSVVSGDRAESKDTSFAAFKALPVGATHIRNGSRYAEPADDLATATSCKEAVDLIVDGIKRACEDIGNVPGDDFVSEEDVVRLVCSYRTFIVGHAQRSVPVCQRHSVRRASTQRWSTG